MATEDAAPPMPAIPAPAAPAPAGTGLALVAATGCLALALFGPFLLNDADTFWHVAAGQWELAHRAVPHADTFSFTVAGRPWHAHEWLSELLMAAAFRIGGWTGVVALFAAALAGLAAILALALRRSLPPAAAAVTLLLALCCIGPSLLARPHMLGLLALALWTWALLRATARGRPAWAALPLMALWANLHGGFMLGLVLAVPLSLEAVRPAGPGPGAWLRAARPWGVFLVAAVGSAALTPQGVGGLLFPFMVMRQHALAMIAEWQPLNLAVLQPVELAVAAALFVLLTRGVRLPPWRLLALFGLLHMALAQGRQGMVLGVAGSLLLAGPLGAALGGPRQRPGQQEQPRPVAIPHTGLGRCRKAGRGAAGWRLGPALAAMACLNLLTLRAAHPVTLADSAVAPVAALRAVPPALAARPMLNAYDFGGFLILQGLHPFVDGRADLYGDAFLQEYGALQANPAALAAAVDRWNLRWAILLPGSPVVALLEALPGWHRLYADRHAVVAVRDDPDRPYPVLTSR